MERIICLAIGYVCGLFQTSYIYGKAKGIDIRQHGSGNAGTTNALRTLGMKAGMITLLGDCVKCIVAVLLVGAIFGESCAPYLKLLQMYAAAGTILGHNFPFYMNFKGGKGIAATAGLLLSFSLRLSAIALVLFLIILFTVHYVSLGSMVVYVVFMIGTIVLGQSGYFGMNQAHLNELYVVAALLTVMAIYRHRANIVRLINGTERKTYLTSKHKEKA